MSNKKHPAEKKYMDLKLKAEEQKTLHEDKTVVMVGTATCGKAAGAIDVRETFKEEIKKRELNAEVVEVGCIGHCYAEPLIVISKPGFPSLCYGNVDEGLSSLLVENFLVGDDPCYEFAMVALEPNEEFPTFTDFPRGTVEKKVILEQCGLIDPEDINDYIAVDGYHALSNALGMKAGDVVEMIKESRLRGRGGAGFPTGKKWEICTNTQDPVKYVICNADEGDPGAFMDRSILESNPHQVIEGLIICGYAVGASQGFVYIRSEYPQAIRRINTALEQAREKGLLGKNILGTEFNFDIEVFLGSGAFVCGEETALINSMEGKTGMPRHRPPFPAEAGFRGNPTIINNVKTLSYVTHILNKGVEWFTSIGTPGSPGTAVFALVGKVENTGLVEVPMGTTLRTLVYDVGGGIRNEKAFKAVQIGGPSGGCLPESALDIPIDFDSLQEAGAVMGSGGLVVLDENDCMVEIARFFLDFTQKESCGKCTFCRLGTKHMLDILKEITIGQGKMEHIEILGELALDIKNGSLCGLGKTAPNPVLTTLRYFMDEYKEHIQGRRCPALMCPELINFYIVPQKCSKLCSACVGSCPVEAIYTREDGLKAIDLEKCVKCNSCPTACPPEYDAIIKVSPPELVEELEKENA